MLRLGPVRLHWSLLLGAALFCALQPDAPVLAGYGALLAVHVLGHAVAVVGTRLRVDGVMLHALGGELLGEGETTPVRRSLVALAGAAAQALVLLAALWLPLPPELHEAFTRRNGVLILMNLIPVKPLDGALAWKLPARWRAARRLRTESASPRAVEKDVADLLRRIRGSTRVR